jgi:hypothetical protein
MLKQLSGTHLGTLIAAALASSLPFGFMISSTTICCLKVARLWGWNYETDMTMDDVRTLWPLLGMTITIEQALSSMRCPTVRRVRESRLRAFVSVTVDHHLLFENAKGIQEWMTRSYSAYVVSLNSIFALLLSLVPISLRWGSRVPLSWWLAVVIVTGALLWGAVTARNDTMRMQRLQRMRLRSGEAQPLQFGPVKETQ